MRRTAPHLPADLDDDQRALYDAIVDGPRGGGPRAVPLVGDDGSLQGPFDGFLLAPTIGDGLQRLGAAIRYGTGLADRAREAAILAVAAREGSAFETVAHEAVGRTVGLDEGQLAALRAGQVPAGLEPAEVHVLHVVGALLDGDIDDASWDRASRELGPRTLMELIALVGYYRMLALQMRVLRVDDPAGS